jgi:hypothetical protein
MGMEANKRKGVRANAKSNRTSQAVTGRTARRGVCRRANGCGTCSVESSGAKAAKDCRGVDPAEARATVRERLMKDVRRCSWSPYRAAFKANPHDPLHVANVVMYARLAASALLAIASTLEEACEPDWETPADGSAAEGSTGGITEGHTPNA